MKIDLIKKPIVWPTAFGNELAETLERTKPLVDVINTLRALKFEQREFRVYLHSLLAAYLYGMGEREGVSEFVADLNSAIAPVVQKYIERQEEAIRKILRGEDDGAKANPNVTFEK